MTVPQLCRVASDVSSEGDFALGTREKECFLLCLEMLFLQMPDRSGDIIATLMSMAKGRNCVNISRHISQVVTPSTCNLTMAAIEGIFWG